MTGALRSPECEASRRRDFVLYLAAGIVIGKAIGEVSLAWAMSRRWRREQERARALLREMLRVPLW